MRHRTRSRYLCRFDGFYISRLTATEQQSLESIVLSAVCSPHNLSAPELAATSRGLQNQLVNLFEVIVGSSMEPIRSGFPDRFWAGVKRDWETKLPCSTTAIATVVRFYTEARTNFDPENMAPTKSSSRLTDLVDEWLSRSKHYPRIYRPHILQPIWDK
jgi:hypothetical protein